MIGKSGALADLKDRLFHDLAVNQYSFGALFEFGQSIATFVKDKRETPARLKCCLCSLHLKVDKSTYVSNKKKKNYKGG